MSHDAAVIDALLRDVDARLPCSLAMAELHLSPLTNGVLQVIPVLTSGARLFRITNWCGKPGLISDVGARPPKDAPIGRLNDVNQSVLYVADSPDTAFSEARAGAGCYSLAEWQIRPPRVALANGGISESLLRARFPTDFSSSSPLPALGSDERVLELFQRIFALRVDSDSELYRWSIGCGLACGFASTCERTGASEVAGATEWTGRYPFAAIAYASTRADKDAINFAFNDLGQTLLQLKNVQWVERHADGSFSGLDFASSWGTDGSIAWQKRPARLLLQPGASARVVKIDETVWRYETEDGDTPYFA